MRRFAERQTWRRYRGKSISVETSSGPQEIVRFQYAAVGEMSQRESRGVSHLSNCGSNGITGHIWGSVAAWGQGQPWCLTFQRFLGLWGQHGWRIMDRPA